MWLTAIILGFAGSMHCLGMCSPLAMAVTSMKPAAVLNRIVYNSGRILTYAAMGAIVASVGLFLPFQKFQNVISIGLGIILLAIGLGGIKSLQIPGISRWVQRGTSQLKKLFARQINQRSRAAMFVMGSLNGFLPCGLTLIALTWCLSLQGPVDGFNFMLLFGVGTLPVMLGFTGFIPAIVKRLKWNLQRVTTAMLVFSGCVLILRVLIIHVPHTISARADLVDIILCR